MEKTEKSIQNIGRYFLVIGIICSCLAPIYISSGSIMCAIIVVLMCSPRLIYQNKKWASVLLMISAILTTLALLCFDGVLILFSGAFGPIDVLGVIFVCVIAVIVILNCYLCYRLFKLLFKTKEAA